MYGDKADYLRPPFTPAWEKRFAALDVILGDMAKKTRAAGADFFLVIGPQRIQAALLDQHGVPPGTDPWAFGRRVSQIAAAHGIPLLDSLEAFARVPHPEKLFYAVDGHLNAEGHEILAEALADRLADRSIPAFAHCGGVAVSTAR
jgi:lysophospholipase L1-like esterase